MVSPQVTSALVMGVLAVIVVAAVARSRPWESYRPAAVGVELGETPGGGGAASRTDGTGLWVGLFLVLALGALAGVGLFVSSAGASAGLLSGPIAVGAALFVGAYLVLGVYVTARGRGHPSSMAAAETATVCGVLFLIAVSTQLIGA
jgi:hypothetical protein